MAKPSLQTKINESGDVVGMLRNSRIGMYVYPVVALGVHELARRAARLARDARCSSTSRTTWTS